MPVDVKAISVGRCYLTHTREVRKVLEVDGQKVVYVTRGKMAFPTWDPEARRSTTKEAFAVEAEGEVPCEAVLR